MTSKPRCWPSKCASPTKLMILSDQEVHINGSLNLAALDSAGLPALRCPIERRCLLFLHAAALLAPGLAFFEQNEPNIKTFLWTGPLMLVPSVLCLMYFSSKCHDTHRSSKTGSRRINVSCWGDDSGLWPLSPLSICSRPAAGII